MKQESKKPQGTIPSLDPDSVIVRAVKAIHDTFEKSLFSEWNVLADAAKVRNAMGVLPNRCRQCKKPGAGLGSNICTCKGKIEFERCLSNPRGTLVELFRQKCQSVQVSPSLTNFVEQITEVSIANGYDPYWVERQIESLEHTLSRICRRWIIEVCGLPFTASQLPAWLKDDGVVLDQYLRLTTEESDTELLRINTEGTQYFEEAKKEALDRASIQIARVARPTAKRASRKSPRPDIISSVIARIKRDRQNPSIKQICLELDSKKIPLRTTDQRAGFSSWHAIWEDLEYRNRIKRFVSEIPPAAAEKKV